MQGIGFDFSRLCLVWRCAAYKITCIKILEYLLVRFNEFSAVGKMSRDMKSQSIS